MRKIIFLFILVCFIISGCGGENLPIAQENTPKPQVVALNEEDFIIRDENNYIKLDDKYENLVTNEKVTSILGVTENRAYESYVYESFVVSVASDIFRISIISPAIETSRGIRVGDSMETVFEKYGMAEFLQLDSATGYYMYSHEAKFVRFNFDSSKKVSSILIECV